MSWITDLIDKGSNLFGYDSSNSWATLPDLFTSNTEVPSAIDAVKGTNNTSLGPWLTAGSSIASTLGGLYNNKSNTEQVSKQWDAQFAYNQQRDTVNDAYREEALKAQVGAANAAAGATVKAAGINAAAQNKRTLADLYGNIGNQIGGQAQRTVQGFNMLGSAVANPYLARR